METGYVQQNKLNFDNHVSRHRGRFCVTMDTDFDLVLENAIMSHSR